MARVAVIKIAVIIETIFMLLVEETQLQAFYLVTIILRSSILLRALLRAASLFSQVAILVIVVLFRLFQVYIQLTSLLFLLLNLLSKLIMVQGLLQLTYVYNSVLDGGIFAVLLVHQILKWLQESGAVILGDYSTSELNAQIKKSKVELVQILTNTLTRISELV